MKKRKPKRKVPRPQLRAVPLASRSEDARHYGVGACLDEVKTLCKEEGYDSVFVVAFCQDNDRYRWSRHSAGPACRVTTILGVLDVVHADLIEERRED
jgi:hypothetical protein